MANFYKLIPDSPTNRFVMVEGRHISFWTDGDPQIFIEDRETCLGEALASTSLYHCGDEAGFWAKFRSLNSGTLTSGAA
jgi:hypothetical protein